MKKQKNLQIIDELAKRAESDMNNFIERQKEEKELLSRFAPTVQADQLKAEREQKFIRAVELLEGKDRKNHSKNQIPVFLTADGDLYLKPLKKGLIYPTEKDSKRIDLLLSLTNEFQITANLTKFADYKNDAATRVAIAEIKRKVEFHLKINDLIENKRTYGYRLNPKYKIVKE